MKNLTFFTSALLLSFSISFSANVLAVDTSTNRDTDSKPLNNNNMEYSNGSSNTQPNQPSTRLNCNSIIGVDKDACDKQMQNEQSSLPSNPSRSVIIRDKNNQTQDMKSRNMNPSNSNGSSSNMNGANAPASNTGAATTKKY